MAWCLILYHSSIYCWALSIYNYFNLITKPYTIVICHILNKRLFVPLPFLIMRYSYWKPLAMSICRYSKTFCGYDFIRIYQPFVINLYWFTFKGTVHVHSGWLRVVAKQRVHRHNDPRCTESTLRTMAFGQALLKYKHFNMIIGCYHWGKVTYVVVIFFQSMSHRIAVCPWCMHKHIL